jgi:hypothetical protein
MNKFVEAFCEAVKSHNAMAGLSADEPAQVHLWHILASALSYADYHSLDFDSILADARNETGDERDHAAARAIDGQA